MPTWESLTPYMDEAVGHRRWSLTKILVIAHVAGFAVSAIFQIFIDPTLFKEVMMLQVRGAVDAVWVWQFVTYAFTDHPINLLWFLIFTIMLYQWGEQLEGTTGPRKMLIIYFAGIIYGGLIHCAYQRLNGSFAATGGFMHPGFYAVMMTVALHAPRQQVRLFFIIPMRMMTCALIFVGIDAFLCVIYFPHGTAPFASLGSAATAYVLFKCEPTLDRWLNRREQWQERRRETDSAQTRQKVDALLQKISEQGMGSLSSVERRFLKKASHDTRHSKHYPD